MKSVRDYSSRAHQIRYILGALIALVISDGLISQFLITQGLAWEGNPFLETLVGGDTFLTIKVLGVLVSALILWDVYRQWPRLALISSLCFLTLYTVIIIWNLSVFFVTQV